MMNLYAAIMNFIWPKNASINLVYAFLLGAMTISMAKSAIADIIVRVDISEQFMTVYSGGERLYGWTVSTGSIGFETPDGEYRPVRMHESWYSKKYDGVPMPNSIFYHGGYAIHGTLETRTLGRPASRGCVRLHPENAKLLFDLVMKDGMSRTLIIIEE
jgi:lipoprotein-anchoring transpeptidase ErfK/SrfK